MSLASPAVHDSRADDSVSALIGRVAAGDQGAFAELYDQTAAAMLAVIRCRIDDATQAESILETVYVELWRQAGTFDPTTERPLTWMLTRARRASASAITPAALPTRRRLRDRFAGLTACEREVVLLASAYGHTQLEIATITASTLDEVKDWMRSGLRALRRAAPSPSIA